MQYRNLVQKRNRRRAGLAIAVAMLGLSGGALAQWGTSGAVFTETGIEIAVDARVTSLYAMLNGLGYDKEVLRGPPPLELPQYTDAREKARSALGRPGPGMKEFEKLVTQEKRPMTEFIEASLELGGAPRFEPQGKVTKLAQSLAEPMREWFNEEGGVGIYRQVVDSSKAEQKLLLEPLNKVTRDLTRAVPLGDEEDQLLDDDTGPSGRVVVIVNALETHGALHRARFGETTYIIAGPAADETGRNLIAEAAAVAFARTLVEREAKKVAKKGTVGDLYGELSPDAHAALGDGGDLAAEMLGCAIYKAVSSSKGCFGSPILGEPALEDPMITLESKVKAWMKTGEVLQKGASGLLAHDAAAPAPADDKGAGGKPKGRSGK